jgi:transcriptional regulator with XRE-family HTH domain
MQLCGNMAELSIKQKKEWAKTLYVHQRLTQKETAEKVGVSAKTLNQWVNKEAWDTLRVSIIITKDQQLSRLYAQINELNNKIEQRAEGERYADSKEADTLVKLTSAAQSLETETGLSQIIEVAMLFTGHLKAFDLTKAKEVTNLFDEFIASRIK